MALNVNSSQTYTRRSTDRPEFKFVPYREDAMSIANVETVRKVIDQLLPLLRELRQLNWKVEVMDGF